jgi:hypothetical protein
MNGSVKHHGAHNAHDGLDGSFSTAIMMVGSSTCEPSDLCECREALSKSLGSEWLAVVRLVGLCNDNEVPTHKFKQLL